MSSDTRPVKKPLTDARIRSLKPREKPYKVFDTRGLYFLIYPDGRRGWRFKYHYGGREKLLSMGSYPDTSLKLAREKRDEARSVLATKTDPSAKRQAEKRAQLETFEAVAREWLKRSNNSEGTIARAKRRLELFVFPYLGKTPISEITAQELLQVLRRIESQGKYETAHRVRSLCSRIFRYAIVEGWAERDVSADLRGALTTVKVKHLPAITDPKRIGELLRALDGYEGQPAVMQALRLAPLVFVRPGELRAAEWIEIDLDGAEWRIPAERMKMNETHIVPLSTQAIAIIEELHSITGHGRFLFPSLRTNERPISQNTLNAALRRLGYSKEEMTAHGFRTIASTQLNELGWSPDVIELQLAHVERNKVRAAYNRAERMAERRKMMQAWADYLDGLRQSDNVVNLNRQGKA